MLPSCERAASCAIDRAVPAETRQAAGRTVGTLGVAVAAIAVERAQDSAAALVVAGATVARRRARRATNELDMTVTALAGERAALSTAVGAGGRRARLNRRE